MKRNQANKKCGSAHALEDAGKKNFTLPVPEYAASAVQRATANPLQLEPSP